VLSLCCIFIDVIKQSIGKIVKKIAIYVRVSTNKQDSTNQLIELRDLAKRMNYEIVQEYIQPSDSTKERSYRNQYLW